MGGTGLEPVTPSVSCWCASQLRQPPGNLAWAASRFHHDAVHHLATDDIRLRRGCKTCGGFFLFCEQWLAPMGQLLGQWISWLSQGVGNGFFQSVAVAFAAERESVAVQR